MSEYIWRLTEPTSSDVRQGEQAWEPVVPVGGHTRQRDPGLDCDPGPLRGFEPDGSSSDQQGGVSEAGWAFPSPGRHRRVKTITADLHQVAVSVSNRSSCVQAPCSAAASGQPSQGCSPW